MSESSAAVDAVLGSAPEWWRRAVVYQVYIRSFADGNGDGMGDLAGIRSRLPYLRDLGVDAIWVNPWYPSPMVDGGYDVADYRAIDPRFGSLDEARGLIDEVHALGMRIVADIVPNHTSSAHDWFREAVASAPGSRARDRYHFRDGRGRGGAEPPNNWQSIFGGPAWTRVDDPDGQPGQWYLHLFDPGQPDLNWDDPEVQAEFEAVLAFWFELGIDGFRIDVAHGLAKAPGLPDFPDGADQRTVSPHPHWGLEATHSVYRRWRQVADAYPGDRFLIGEVFPGETAPVDYVVPGELHQTFAFDFLQSSWDAGELRSVIAASLWSCSRVGAPPAWVLSNHDVVRHVTRYGRPYSGLALWDTWVERQEADLDRGRQRARAAILLMLALPGSAFLYQGEELGLAEVVDLPDELLEDPTWERSGHTYRGRDGCRVPIPWSGAAPPFGFGPPGSQPWLPQPAAWASRTADAQDGDPASMLELYRAALRLRRELPGLATDALGWLEAPDGVLHFARDGIRCAVNLADEPFVLPAGSEILLRSDGKADGSLPRDTACWYRPG
jgi:alpha-glucosidase